MYRTRLRLPGEAIRVRVLCPFRFLSVNASGLLAFVCRTCRIQYDGMPLHCLLCLLHYRYIVVYVCRVFVATELVSL